MYMAPPASMVAGGHACSSGHMTKVITMVLAGGRVWAQQTLLLRDAFRLIRCARLPSRLIILEQIGYLMDRSKNVF